LAGGFLAVALACAVVGIIGVRGIVRINDADEMMYEKMTKPLVNLTHITEAFQRIRVNLRDLVLATSAAERDAAAARIKELRAEIEKNSEEFEKSLMSDEAKADYRAFLESRKAYGPAVDRIVELAIAGKSAEAHEFMEGEAKKLAFREQEAIDKLVEVKVETAHKTAAQNQETGRSAIRLMIVMVVVGVGASIGLGAFLVVTITRSLTRASEALSDGAAQVASASSQLSSSASSLAEGSSEQAASLEETSSAMEEMAAMTMQNAENAGQAKQLADRAGESVRKANGSMEGMVGSMAQISSKGEEIGKIIKTIDEIAFQTNLLALNAAVEAARAGEAGAGFAVVADEVRNLAQRAAGAAKNTSELIEQTIREIREGTSLVERTSGDFGDVAMHVSKVTELVGEISAASTEQSRGISEVGRAITQMDKVTQTNAAGAEEIASSSEEMNAQALSLNEVVTTLRLLVHGEAGATVAVERSARQAGPRALRPAPPAPPAARIRPSGRVAGGLKAGSGASRGVAPAPVAGRKRSAEEEIPFDDGPMDAF
jgi:methyl-accepting chemotaxis protein